MKSITTRAEELFKHQTVNTNLIWNTLGENNSLRLIMLYIVDNVDYISINLVTHVMVEIFGRLKKPKDNDGESLMYN